MNLVDHNTEETLRLSGTTLKYLYNFIKESKIKHQREMSKKNMKDLEKFYPEKVKIADIHKEDVENFIIKANEMNVDCFEIHELDNTDIYNLKYSLDDEYKIVEIFKEIQLEKEINIDSQEIDFYKLKEELEKYTGKTISVDDFNRIVEDVKKDLNKDKGKLSLEDIKREVESRVKEELIRRQEDRPKRKNKGDLER